MDDLQFETLWNGPRVELPQMLDARERRAFRQSELIGQYKKPLLCFTMNVAGPIKNNELIRRGFAIGVDDFLLQLKRTRAKLLFQEVSMEDTGCEAYFVVDCDPFFLKKLTCELEDRDSLGRLYDMDILYPAAGGFINKIERQEVGGKARCCLICGAPGKDCSSRRLHTVPQLQRKTAEILQAAVLEREGAAIAEYATRSLLYEVSVTPKPGLVDHHNCGSHHDMDFYSFLSSAAALQPYFKECAQIGQTTAGAAAPETFAALRVPGKMAENHMLRATGGVNTHKGAIFSLGIVAAAAGRLSAQSLIPISPAATAETAANTSITGSAGRKSAGAILSECGAMTAGLTAGDFAGVTVENAATVGEKLYALYGITGIRGQMEAGLPAVSEYGLPLMRKLLAEGYDRDRAGAAVLLTLMAHDVDTNMIHRGDRTIQQQEADHALQLLADSDCPSEESLEALDQDYIRRNLSPGGSADLLAICWFLHTMETEAL